MKRLQKTFTNRQELVDYVKALAPWAEEACSDILGGRQAAELKLANIKPISYARLRNYGIGPVTNLSPYIHHGILSLNEVRNFALTLCEQPAQSLKFIQQLAWRDFWQRVAQKNPSWCWEDIEDYKTGFNASEYADTLPDNILNGTTGVACIDAFIQQLITNGYIHNHARMYLASYIVHFCRIKWQVGARWFLKHLLDGDVASNNLSWQWVASTFSHKPYIFNLENVDKYFSTIVDTSPQNNELLNTSYELLNKLLFPKIKAFT
jgi:deoxyribodipyrimidine photo-lyase